MKQLSQGKEDEPIEGRILEDNEEIPVRSEEEKSGGQSGSSFFSDDMYESLRRYYEASIWTNIYK